MGQQCSGQYGNCCTYAEHQLQGCMGQGSSQVTLGEPTMKNSGKSTASWNQCLAADSSPSLRMHPDVRVMRFVVRVQALVRGFLARRRTRIAVLFKMHGVARDKLFDSFETQELAMTCESHSVTVRRVEKRIGFLTLIRALREIIEIQSFKQLQKIPSFSKKKQTFKGGS